MTAAVITGASAGLGAEFTRQLVREFPDIEEFWLIARRVGKLEELAQQFPEKKFVCIGLNLLDPKSFRYLGEKLAEQKADVRLLVNNAGCAVSGAIWKLPKQDIDWITELNFLSHLYGMKIFLPQMIAQGTPCEIVNVESTAGLMTSGKATMYHATKAAGVAASESVYIAMKEQGYPIHIHCLVPAYVKTTIHLADLHRPERFAMNDDPYYTSDEYKAGQIRGERGVMSGIPDWYVGECVFTAVEDEKFYIFTHP